MFLANLMAFLIRAPILLVWLTGIVLSLVFWKRHKAVSALTLVAFLGFFIVELASGYLNVWLPTRAIHNGMSAARLSALFAAKGLVQAGIEFVLWILVAFAIFGWRKPSDN